MADTDKTEEVIPTYPESLVRARIEDFIDRCDSSVKVSDSFARLSAEYFRLVLIEAIHRAHRVAEAEGCEEVQPTHIEKILPQLILDLQ